jgi:hypothetical protein
VSLTRCQMEKIFNHKSLIILLGHLWEAELTYRYIFAFKFTLRSQQPDIVPIFNLLPVSLKPEANLPLVSKTLAKLVAKFAAGLLTLVANLPPVSLMPVVHLDLRISQ